MKSRETAPSARPTGTVAFLFSDIENSTPRWESDAPAMASAVARHDALMRHAIESHGGYVFKTVGDAFCAAFPRSSDAISAAVDAQQILAAEDFSVVDGIHVRMAVHAGSANERDGDYFGPAVNRVARLLGLGHGGQILVSDICRELTSAETPSAYDFRDLGEHRLEGIASAERVYQLLAPGLPDAFPPLRSTEVHPTNLPVQLTSFVGRDETIAQVSELLQQHRLVTLVGTGGVGKTRCAIRTGEQLLSQFADGVWLVELAPISDGSLVGGAVARTFNLRDSPSRPILSALTGYLKRKRLVLILDNCEHVIAHVRDIAAAILRDCPEIRLIATSREMLNIAGEEVYRLSSLPLGDAVRLFADRAVSAEKRFSLTDDNASDVADICRRLDGIPLAIELAAARVKILSPQQLAQRLDERFRVLSGGDRSALPRHQTMRALIDWSYELLSAEEQLVFRKLSIFAGGFTIDAASAILREHNLDELGTLEILASLVDKSLVQAEPFAGTIRYRLLESMRQYARERLIESHELPATARAHAAAYVELAERLDRDRDTIADDVWNAQVEPEMENFRAALEWTLGGNGDVALGQRLAAAMRNNWVRIAPAEGLKWIRAGIAGIDETTPDIVIARLDLAEGSLEGVLHRHRQSYDALHRALERLKFLDDPTSLAGAQARLGNALLQMGRVSEGEVLLQAAYETCRRIGSHRLASWALNTLGLARAMNGDLTGARDFYARALATITGTGHEEIEAEVLLDFAEVEFRAGDPASAVRLVSEARDRCGWSRFRSVAAVGLVNLAAYLIALNRYDEARASAVEALTVNRDLGLTAHVAVALLHIAATAALEESGDPVIVDERRVTAARLLGYVGAQYAALGAEFEYTEALERERVLRSLRATFPAQQLDALVNEGAEWGEERATSQASLI